MKKSKMTPTEALDKLDHTICLNINNQGERFKFGLDTFDHCDCQDFDEFDEAITVLRKYIEEHGSNE